MLKQNAQESFSPTSLFSFVWCLRVRTRAQICTRVGFCLTNKHVNFFLIFVGKAEAYMCGASASVFKTLYLFHNLRMGSISEMFAAGRPFKPCLTIRFLRNLRMCPFSKSVALNWTGMACGDGHSSLLGQFVSYEEIKVL